MFHYLAGARDVTPSNCRPPLQMLPTGFRFPSLSRRWRMAGAVLASVVALASGLSQAAQAADGVAQLERFVASTPQASGRFTQTLVKEGGGTARPSTGVFAYARPGRFRWDIQKPYEQLIVTDGKQLHFYDKDLQQVTVKPVSEAMSTTPAALLFGGGDIERAFRLSDEASGPDAEGIAWVDAVPLSREAGFERLRIGMRAGLPARMDVIDAFGQQTRFSFEAIDVTARPAAEQFVFVPPPDVDVLR